MVRLKSEFLPVVMLENKVNSVHLVKKQFRAKIF